MVCFLVVQFVRFDGAPSTLLAVTFVSVAIADSSILKPSRVLTACHPVILSGVTPDRRVGDEKKGNRSETLSMRE